MNFLNKFLSASILLLPVLSVSAQEDFAVQQANDDDPDFIYTNVDGDGKHIRGAYLTNPWYSNWDITLMGGVQTLVSGTGESNVGFDLGTARITPAFELSLAKWFTPVIAVRLGVQGISLEENFKPHYTNHYPIKHVDGVNSYSSLYLHGGVMWNFVNSIWGYRANRFYNVSPYAHVGFMRMSHPDEPFFTNVYRDRELAFGFGLYNTFRISNSFNVIADLRWGNISGRFHDAGNGGRVNHFTAMAGISYSIKYKTWSRSRGIENARDKAIQDADNAMAALDDVKKENEQLKAQIVEINTHAVEKEIVTVPTTVFLERVANSDLVLYYQINLSKLNFSEENHLHTFVTETLKEEPKHVFYLTGSADKGTGSLETNTRLSRERANAVKNILMNKYNVPEDQIVIKATIISDKHEDGGLDRCVLIEKE